MNDTTQNEPLGNSETARDATGTLDTQRTATTETSKDLPKDTKTEEQPPKDEKPVVPEKYEFKAPEGFKLDDSLVEKASGVFKELGISQEGAQKLFDLYSAKAVEAAEAPLKAYNDMRADWRSKVVSDPKYGDGNDLKPEVRATIGRMVESLGADLGKPFVEAMELTGAADHPAVFAALLELSKRVTEGRPVTGSGPSKEGQKAPGAPALGAHALFPNLP